MGDVVSEPESLWVVNNANGWTHQTVGGQGCGAHDWDENCHHLVTWNLPQGNNPHYHGTGGDNATCLTTHGCIGNWAWWLQNPQSRLGVPKTFYFPQSWGGAQNANSYSASVWLN